MTSPAGRSTNRAQPGGRRGGIAAAEWQGTRGVRAVYTYGQPAIGLSGYRDFIGEHYADSYFRFVNEDDVVPAAYRPATSTPATWSISARRALCWQRGCWSSRAPEG